MVRYRKHKKSFAGRLLRAEIKVEKLENEAFEKALDAHGKKKKAYKTIENKLALAGDKLNDATFEAEYELGKKSAKMLDK